MPVWRFIPVARQDDASWLGGPIWPELFVSAETSGSARQIASAWEAEFVGYRPSDAAGGQAMDYHSALANPELYRLEEADAAPPGTSDGVIPPAEGPIWPTARTIEDGS